MFQTNESYSLGIGYLTANSLGGENIQNIFGTDLSKNKKIVEIILRKATIQLENENNKMIPIDDAQIRRIYHPFGQLTFPLGKMIISILNLFVNSTMSGWRFLIGKKRPKKLMENMEMENLEKGWILREN